MNEKETGEMLAFITQEIKRAADRGSAPVARIIT